MLDSLTVPRRAYDFEDYIDILRRNMRWLIAPTFAGLVISTVVAYMQQDIYFSAALIRVTPQQISTDLVKTATSQDVADRISSMSQTILSRNTLTSLITTYGLYKKELTQAPMEDVLDAMKKSISIVPVGGTSAGTKFLPAMQVGFYYSDRYVAQKVSQDLVSRFMSLSTENVMDSQQNAYAFLKNQADSAKRNLDDISRRLDEYRAKNAGHLPDEMSMNMQQMNALGGRLEQLTEAQNRNVEERMMLNTELNQAKDRLALIHSPQTTLQNQKVASYDQQIEQLEYNIAQMKERYTDDYPDLQTARDQVAFLKRQRDQTTKEKPTSVPIGDTGVIARDRLDAQAQVDQIQTRLKANQMDAQLMGRDIASTSAALRSYQARAQGLPAGEKEYSDLLRDRDMAKAGYLEMSAKLGASDISMNMERHKQGEGLELLDAASLPVTPVAPNRKRTIPIGAVIGFVVGAVLVAVREVKDTSLKNLKDARLYTNLTILGSIPLLENDVVVQRRKQVMWVGWATATLLGLAVAGGSIAHYYLSRG